MKVVKAQSGQVIARKNDKVKYWYLIQEGTVIQKFDFSEVRLGKNAIVGILEKDIFLCDYIVGEDATLAAFVCESTEDLMNILTGQEKIRHIFLKTAIEQRHNLLTLYSDLYSKARQFHMFVENTYNNYITFCGKYKIEEQSFSRMEHFNPLVIQHRAETWEVNNSMSLIKTYMQEYLQLMEKDDGLTVGVIMETSAQMRRFAQGIREIESYLSYNKDILFAESLFAESRNDLFRLYFDLSIKMYEKKYELTDVKENIDLMVKFAEKTKIYDEKMVQRRLKEFNNYDYAKDDAGAADGGTAGMEMDITSVDALNHILKYAGYEFDEMENISEQIIAYRNLPDMLSSDKEAYSLRKSITTAFYEIYYKVFMRAVKDESTLTPVLEMFLNFGFMDLSYVGEEHAKALYNLCSHLDICQSEHIYTIYKWLKDIYHGRKEPSKNQFDMNYSSYLADLYKNGKISKEQIKEYYENRQKRVQFEIQNMFATVNKVTYGRISTFCPILCENDLINSIEKMLVTAEKLEEALNEIRKMDYSIFYREIPFSDPAKGINSDRIMKEVLPDIILMPNAGTKAMMWQEISGIKSDTPARFMFPIFTAVDLNELMVETLGRYRWEMCRRLEGVHWNDVREKSLTAEYCTYIQFYRNNRDLSAEAKEKLKASLAQAKNNYREVFVKDYINWIKFESKGSFRLNKIARDILIRYCPFVKSIRDELKANPMYQTSITRFEADMAKKLQRYNALYNKYTQAGGKITEELNDNLLFYQM